MSNEVRTGVHNVLPYKTIGYEHYECHVGNMNYANASFYSIANGESSNILVSVNSSKEAHFGFSIATNGPMIFKFYEGTFPVATSYGNILSPINMNRNFATSAGTVFFAATNLTGGTIGTLLVSQLIVGETGGGTGTNVRISAGGVARNDTEWILKPATNYLISLVNTSGVARDLNIETEFYEE